MAHLVRDLGRYHKIGTMGDTKMILVGTIYQRSQILYSTKRRKLGPERDEHRTIGFSTTPGRFAEVGRLQLDDGSMIFDSVEGNFARPACYNLLLKYNRAFSQMP